MLDYAWRNAGIGWKHERTKAALEHPRGPVQHGRFISSSN
jgi:hypothetical protein